MINRQEVARPYGLGQTFHHIYTGPDGRRLYVADGVDRQQAADQARLEAFRRAQGIDDDDSESAVAPRSTIWSRTPTPEQEAARIRAVHAFVSNLRFITDEGMPQIRFRWLLEDDDPGLAGAWGICRMEQRGACTVILRADAEPGRVYSTTLHELMHAADHELLWLGAPRDVLEGRAKHIQHVLAEAP
jgi:hypothetical protein